MIFSLEGKIALVTGAGSGIGAAIAKLFAQVGAQVFVTDRAEGSGREVVQQIVEAGGRAEFALLDISDLSQCAAVADRVLNAFGRLDILVNNAGIGNVGTMVTTEVDDPRSHLLRSMSAERFSSRKAFLRSMLERKAGAIVKHRQHRWIDRRP
jgi:NAD(P)-dependent dehydrogenase (short-subunit alcohol dehydrogenase family)